MGWLEEVKPELGSTPQPGGPPWGFGLSSHQGRQVSEVTEVGQLGAVELSGACWCPEDGRTADCSSDIRNLNFYVKSTIFSMLATKPNVLETI